MAGADGHACMILLCPRIKMQYERKINIFVMKEWPMSKTDDKNQEPKKSILSNLNRFKYGTAFMTGGNPGGGHGHNHGHSHHAHGAGCGCSGPATDADEDME